MIDICTSSGWPASVCLYSCFYRGSYADKDKAPPEKEQVANKADTTKLTQAEEEDLFGPKPSSSIPRKRKLGILDFSSTAPKRPMRLVDAKTGEDTYII